MEDGKGGPAGGCNWRRSWSSAISASRSKSGAAVMLLEGGQHQLWQGAEVYDYSMRQEVDGVSTAT
eukprot:714720-Prymnesium_polylepis.2